MTAFEVLLSKCLEKELQLLALVKEIKRKPRGWRSDVSQPGRKLLTVGHDMQEWGLGIPEKSQSKTLF